MRTGAICAISGKYGDRNHRRPIHPLPLTIHLGGGSDKFIGSGNDYCRHGGGSDG